jgi:hypothetical protein
MSSPVLLSGRTGSFDSEPATKSFGIGQIVEMLLKDRSALDLLLRTEAGQNALIPRLLAIAMASFGLYGVTLTAVLNGLRAVHGFWQPGVPAAYLNSTSCGSLALAYCLGMIAANGICLPSFYFYALLSGIRVTMVGVVAHALKGMAAGALALVGILPLYAALVLSAMVFSPPTKILAGWTLLGLMLPFLAGVWGAICLYEGFVCLADTIPAERRGKRRCFLRRLIVAWSGCYMLVTPLAIYTLWNHLVRALP